jgi:hypothetical protein
MAGDSGDERAGNERKEMLGAAAGLSFDALRYRSPKISSFR